MMKITLAELETVVAGMKKLQAEEVYLDIDLDYDDCIQGFEFDVFEGDKFIDTVLYVDRSEKEEGKF